MADALYVQALRKVAADVATFNLTSLHRDATIPVRRLEWRDVTSYSGITVRYTDQRRVHGFSRATNERDIYGYPCHVIVTISHELELNPTGLAVFRLKQELTRHFHLQRTMESLTFAANEDPLPTTVDDGPRPPAEYADQSNHIYTWTVWAWFIEPRDDTP